MSFRGQETEPVGENIEDDSCVCVRTIFIVHNVPGISVGDRKAENIGTLLCTNYFIKDS